MTLPPLPKPADQRLHAMTRESTNYFTQHQMLQFQRDTVEACAKVCDELVSQTVGQIAATGEQLADELRGMK